VGCISRAVLVQPALGLKHFPGFRVVWILSPRHPNFADFDRRPEVALKTAHVILMTVGRDHNINTRLAIYGEV
jgi:hypothetical protein